MFFVIDIYALRYGECMQNLMYNNPTDVQYP